MNTFTAIKEILVTEDRQRQAFDEAAMFELVEDIKANGLIQPIVLVDLTLVAGERRLRAVKELHDLGIQIKFAGQPVEPGFIPSISYAELSALERAQVEYSENEFRQALSWQERAKAQALLAKIKSLESGGTADASKRVAAEVYGDLPTADQLSTVRTNINVARYLDDPEVAKASTAKEAAKIIKRREQTATNKLAAERFEEITRSAPDLSKIHTLVKDSCVHYLRRYTGEKFDCIVSDPPYGIGAHNFGDGTSNVKGQHQYDDSYEAWSYLMPEFVDLAFKHSQPTAAMYLFCDIEMFSQLKRYCEAAGWYVHRTPLIWYKGKNGLVPIPGESHARSYEVILFATKGKPQLQRTAPDVIIASTDANLGHGAQKPVALFEELLARTVPKGSYVADFFAGSGPIIEAAHRHSCRSLSVELDEAHFGIMCQRLEDLKNG